MFRALLARPTASSATSAAAPIARPAVFVPTITSTLGSGPSTTWAERSSSIWLPQKPKSPPQ